MLFATAPMYPCCAPWNACRRQMIRSLGFAPTEAQVARFSDVIQSSYDGKLSLTASTHFLSSEVLPEMSAMGNTTELIREGFQVSCNTDSFVLSCILWGCALFSHGWLLYSRTGFPTALPRRGRRPDFRSRLGLSHDSQRRRGACDMKRKSGVVESLDTACRHVRLCRVGNGIVSWSGNPLDTCFAWQGPWMDGSNMVRLMCSRKPSAAA